MAKKKKAKVADESPRSKELSEKGRSDISSHAKFSKFKKGAN